MALPASFPISASQINVELGRAPTAAFDIQGTAERDLAEVPSGAISMSDFLGKEAFSVAILSPVAGGGGTTINPVLDFGAANTNRRMFAFVHWYNNVDAVRPIVSATIGGVAAAIHGQDGNHNSSANIGYGVAIISALVPTGTSGTASVTFAGAIGSSVLYPVRAVSLVGTIVDVQTDHVTGSGGIIGVNVNVPALGVLMVAASGQNALGASTTNISNPSPADYTLSNKAGKLLTGQPANASRATSATTTGSDPNVSIVSLTWTGK